MLKYVFVVFLVLLFGFAVIFSVVLLGGFHAAPSEDIQLEPESYVVIVQRDGGVMEGLFANDQTYFFGVTDAPLEVRVQGTCTIGCETLETLEMTEDPAAACVYIDATCTDALQSGALHVQINGVPIEECHVEEIDAGCLKVSVFPVR